MSRIQANGVPLGEDSPIINFPPGWSFTYDALNRAVTLIEQAKSIANPGTNASLQITPQGNTSASVSTGGAVNLDNTLNTGAGAVFFSNQSAPSGRLVVVNAANATYNQAALHVQHAGTGNAVNIVQSNVSPTTSALNVTSAGGNGSSSAHTAAFGLTNSGNANATALNVVSVNTANSAMWLTGSELSRGTLKIAHVGDAGGLDANASAISIDLQTAGTASQGIFMDSTNGASTGNMLELRSNGTTRLRLTPSGNLMIAAPNAAPASTSPPMYNGSVTIWLDEAGNNVKFQCRYSSGTVKTGTLAVV
jgi:hypothetical protein